MDKLEINYLDFLPLVIAIIVPNLGGWLGSLVVTKNMDWYQSLNRPTWAPPTWAFGPVWTILYTLMGIASFIVYTLGGGIEGPAKIPLLIYASQLILNWIWTPIFFGLHNLRLSLLDIAALWLDAALCGLAFYQINQIAGYAFIPYLLWLTIATALNYYIYQNNPEEEKLKKEI